VERKEKDSGRTAKLSGRRAKVDRKESKSLVEGVQKLTGRRAKVEREVHGKGEEKAE
jgi:hypothetical protein